MIFSSSCKKEDQKENPEDITTEDYTITVKDIDGNGYHSVFIGKQEWMVENLKVTKFNDGTPIPTGQTGIEWANLKSPGYCWYDNAESVYKKNYGALYNWYAVNSGKLAPKGWHVPTNEDWIVLVNYLMVNYLKIDEIYASPDSKGFGYYVGPLIVDSVGWQLSGLIIEPKNKHLINKTGFCARPAGGRYDNSAYKNFGAWAVWWSTADPEDTLARGVWSVGFYLEDIYRSYNPKWYGLSVRCIKD